MIFGLMKTLKGDVSFVSLFFVLRISVTKICSGRPICGAAIPIRLASCMEVRSVWMSLDKSFAGIPSIG